MEKTKKLVIALISGGISSEREVSLKSGRCVFEALDKNKYEIINYDPVNIKDIIKLVQDASKIDAALIILHGLYGEDGTIQGLLDLLNIPYQSSGVLGSAVSINKLVSKKLYESAGLKVSPYITVDKNININKLEIKTPVIIKPVNGGSSIGVSVIKNIDLNNIENYKIAINKALQYDKQVLIEEYLDGIELTCGVIGNDNLEALPVIEIIPDKEYEFFDYQAKYTAGATKEICPARISIDQTIRVQECAKKAHQALFCETYSRTDMILRNSDIYILETNTIPGMTPTSLLPLAAQANGFSFTKLLDRLIELSIEKSK